MNFAHRRSPSKRWQAERSYEFATPELALVACAISIGMVTGVEAAGIGSGAEGTAGVEGVAGTGGFGQEGSERIGVRRVCDMNRFEFVNAEGGQP